MRENVRKRESERGQSVAHSKQVGFNFDKNSCCVFQLKNTTQNKNVKYICKMIKYNQQLDSSILGWSLTPNKNLINRENIKNNTTKFKLFQINFTLYSAPGGPAVHACYDLFSYFILHDSMGPGSSLSYKAHWFTL